MMKSLLLSCFFCFTIKLSFAQTITRIDSLPGTKGVVDRILGTLDNTVFYVAETPAGFYAIKAKSPNKNPEILIDSINTTGLSGHEYNFLTQGNLAFFVIKRSNLFYSNILYSSNGSKSGTKEIEQNFTIKFLKRFKKDIVFFNEGSFNSYLSRYRIATDEIEKINTVYSNNGIKDMTVVDSTIYAVGSTTKDNTHLLQSKGEKGDIKKVKLLTTGSDFNESYDILMGGVNGRVFFFYEINNVYNLWTSDGTATGTKTLGVFEKLGKIYNNNYSVGVNGKYYFIANNDNFGEEVWVSDGTIAETKIFDANPGSAGVSPRSIKVNKNKIYFSTFGDIYSIINDQISYTQNLNGYDYTSLDFYKDSILYIADIPNVGIELALTNGVSGYTKLTNGNGTAAKSFKIFSPTITNDNKIYFAGQKGEGNGYELWVYEPKSTTIAPLTLTVTETSKIKCFGDKTAVISSTVAGGTTPYKYLWSNGATTNQLSQVAAGTYKLTVTANNGVTKEASVIVTEPTKLNLTTATKAGNPQFKNGNAVANPSGGTMPYNYAWNTTPIQNSKTAINLAPGTYTVTVTDENQCKITANATVATSTNINAVWEKYNFQIFPNPASNTINLTFNGITHQNIALDIIDITGKSLLSKVTNENNEAIDISTLPVGKYLLKVKIGNEFAITSFLIQR